MLPEKKALSAEQLDAQVAFELPDREMLALVTITVFDVLSHNNVNVQVPIGVAANVCGVPVNVAVLSVTQTGGFTTTCQNGDQTSTVDITQAQ